MTTEQGNGRARERPPFDPEAFTRDLKAAVEKAFQGSGLPPDRVDRLAAFGVRLAEASQSVNLTRILDPAAMAVSHFLDSSHLLPLLKAKDSPVLDIGTGGGVPGMPLAILRRDLDVVMIDGTAKKIRFIRRWIAELELRNATALHARAEEHLRSHRYSAAVLRAAVKPAAMMEILARAGPSLRRVIFMEGAKGQETAREILPLARSAGYAIDLALPYRLPGMDLERFLVCFKRI